MTNNGNAAGSSDPSDAGTRQNRQFVRVYYPKDCPKNLLPELTIRYRSYQIMDISEAGLCFYIPRRNILPDDILTGTIKFTDGSLIDFSGVVVRRSEDQIALKLIVGIPYSYIAAEQIRLRNLEAEGQISLAKK